MNRTRLLAAGLLAVVLAGPSRAQRSDVSPPPVFPRLNNAIVSPHRPVAVPAGLEIEVLDPNVDPRGNPAIVTRPMTVQTCAGPDNRVAVDIPPTVLVHRYYYTGDRTFQAQLLPGGPCIVVTNHPKSGERLYIPVTFPPGAPRVTYTGSSIEYDYGPQAVTISLCCWFHARPKVTYRQGVPLTQKAKNVAVIVRDDTRRLVSRTGIPAGVDKLASGTKSVVVTTVDRVNDLGKALIAPPVALIKATPLGNLFTESPEDQAMKARDSAVKRADDLTESQNTFIPTNR